MSAVLDEPHRFALTLIRRGDGVDDAVFTVEARKVRPCSVNLVGLYPVIIYRLHELRGGLCAASTVHESLEGHLLITIAPPCIESCVPKIGDDGKYKWVRRTAPLDNDFCGEGL